MHGCSGRGLEAPAASGTNRGEGGGGRGVGWAGLAGQFGGELATLVGLAVGLGLSWPGPGES